MKQQFIKFSILFCLGALGIACNPITPAPVVTLPTLTVVIPTSTITLPTPPPSPSQIITSTAGTAQIPKMPGAILDEVSTGWGLALSQFLGQEIVSYSAPASLEAIQDFYQAELTVHGWEWVYTDVGESLALSRPVPILAQEFKQGAKRLSVVAIEGFGMSKNTPTTLVLSGTNVTSSELISFFVGLIAGGLDLGPPNESNIQLQTMHFTSRLIQFDHPSNWFPTRLQMTDFETDTNGRAINVLPEPRRCTNDDAICFVNFAFLTESLFDVPIMIRAYSGQTETNLETFDAQRWARLVTTAENPPTSFDNVERLEDLIDKGSLETIEIKSITLQDGTPALQRLYRWRQVGLSTPLVSSYTLFKHKDTVIEFHTDFSEEEWASIGPEVQATALSIQLSP